MPQKSQAQNAKLQGASGSGAALPRPPVVVVVGHVDHGKTTLLDYIRKANVAAREAGGITQSIGAYEIEVRPEGEPKSRGGEVDRGIPRQARDDFARHGRKITFIDTPGHEAFAGMRERGASIADLAVLVVAADEGVKEQTKEALRVLKETATPFVVALTKTDKPGANQSKVRDDLAANEVFLEGFGGQVSWQGVSAKTGEGVKELLDLILLSAEVENLTYSPSAPAAGYVLETKLDPRRGTEATVILTDGTLRRGDKIFTPTSEGKAKILENFARKPVAELSPSAPAMIIGFESAPKAGEPFLAGSKPGPLETGSPAGSAPRKDAKPAAKARRGDVVVPAILKAADDGSLEALRYALAKIPADKGICKIIEASLGDVSDGDVKTALAAGATIFGFKVKASKSAEVLADARQVPIITADIIYDLADAAVRCMDDIREPKPLGELEVLKIFRAESPAEQLLGGRVTEGAFKSKAAFQILRRSGEDWKQAGQGRVLSLRDKKQDIREAAKGAEAGLLASANVLVLAGDKLVIPRERAEKAK